ncbi:oligosaccharide flippase family protein [Dechloromonas hortensis]|uniref:oligosaccharide flippase family protein n=1 Tax=Dechloromonas hortensis TaxID=337779 RepID=UPI001290D198|nr:oligosaccharide flippase family protein [Dechloromonas hortensis]
MRLSRSFWNLLAVGGTTASRLIGVLILYSLLARMLGPAGFGEFTYWYTIGILLAALSDYGFAQQILIRLVSDSSENIKTEGERLIAAKSILVGILFILAIVFSLFNSSDHKSLYWIIPLLIACAFATLIDFFGVMLRARGSYQNEALRSFFATFVASVGSATAGYFTNSLIVVCLVMLVVRMLVLYYQFLAAKYAVGFESKIAIFFDIRRAAKTLRSGFKFAVDGGAVQLLTNIDVLIAKYVLGSDAAGVYMAGSRLVQAALSGLPVLSNVFIPTLVAQKKTGIVKTPKLMLVAIAAVSMASPLIFWLGADVIPVLLFGNDFSTLANIMPIIGLIVALRYLSSIDGFKLIVFEKQKSRTFIHIALVVFIFAAISMLSISGGFSETKLALCIAAAAVIHLIGFRLVAMRSI